MKVRLLLDENLKKALEILFCSMLGIRLYKNNIRLN
jgi:hypothetical protein